MKKYEMFIDFRINIIADTEEDAKLLARECYYDYARSINDVDIIITDVDNPSYEDTMEQVIEHGFNMMLTTSGEGFYDRMYNIVITNDDEEILHEISGSNLGDLMDRTTNWLNAN